MRRSHWLRINGEQVAAMEPAFALSSCDLTESDELVWHVGRYLPSIKCAPRAAAWDGCNLESLDSRR